MQLFYAPDITSKDILHQIDGQEGQHISRVLRYQPGDRLTVTNGKGWLFTCEITNVSKKAVDVRVMQARFIEEPAYRKVTLAVGLLKNKDRMEWLAEKATEIGVGAIAWLHTDRSERGKLRLDRIEAVMVSAMKQSLQAWLPQTRMIDFIELSNEIHNSKATVVLAHEKSEVPVETADLHADNELYLLIGPEGGFTDPEVENIVKIGGKSLLLGNNRLRTETAALTLLQYYHLSNLSR